MIRRSRTYVQWNCVFVRERRTIRSQIEHGQLDNVAVATLRSYVEALGGRLRVIADFDGDAYLVA